MALTAAYTPMSRFPGEMTHFHFYPPSHLLECHKGTVPDISSSRMQTELCIFPTNCILSFVQWPYHSSATWNKKPRCQLCFLLIFQHPSVATPTDAFSLSPSSSFHDSDPISVPPGFLLRPICEPPVWFSRLHNLPHKLWSVTHPTNLYRAFLLLTLRASLAETQSKEGGSYEAHISARWTNVTTAVQTAAWAETPSRARVGRCHRELLEEAVCGAGGTCSAPPRRALGRWPRRGAAREEQVWGALAAVPDRLRWTAGRWLPLREAELRSP